MKRNPKYENSIWQHFAAWVRGKYDPLKGKLEVKTPPKEKSGINIERYVAKMMAENEEQFELGQKRHLDRFQKAYYAVAIILGIFMTILLLQTISYLPEFGDVRAPENNEVATRYIEKGLEETGAVNIVAGMILDYRAFDTFGESCVLFVAACCVLMLLKTDSGQSKEKEDEEKADSYFEPKNDEILQQAAKVLVPVIVLFGVYVILNGHISPGGGFSGGAIIGAGFIFHLTAYGYEKTRKFLSEKVIKTLTVSALSFYCIAKSYSFYTGANHLHSIITPGTPGAILSAGLIVYLNICVGIVVACTMYSFYVMFRKGDY